MGSSTGSWLLLVAAYAPAMMITILALSSTLSAESDTVTEVEFWHKFDINGIKTAFGEAGAFGEGLLFDYAVLDGEDKEIGRARGISISDSLEGSGVQELFTDTFTAGYYAGSSLTFGGHWNQTWVDNELPVTGGTGVFKFASGSAVFSLELRGSDVYFRVTALLQKVISISSSSLLKGGATAPARRLVIRRAGH